jgi:hypothetical protein
MRKIVFVAALLASTHAFAQYIPSPRWITGQQNGYDATERMNEQNRRMWDQEEANRNSVLQSGGIGGLGVMPGCYFNCD